MNRVIVVTLDGMPITTIDHRPGRTIGEMLDLYSDEYGKERVRLGHIGTFERVVLKSHAQFVDASGTAGLEDRFD